MSFTAPFYVGCLFPFDDDQKELEDKQRIAQAQFHTSTQPTLTPTPTSPSASALPPSPPPPSASDYHSTLFYETIQYQFLDRSLLIRQFDDHPTNANALWPEATFLAEFLTATHTFAPPNQPTAPPSLNTLYSLLPRTARVLELGSATGALAIYLRLHGLHVTTSDVPDPLVTDNIAHNCQLNSVQHEHCEHRWGDVVGLRAELDRRGSGGWDVVLGSDLLAYESSYEGLSETMGVLLPEGEVGEGRVMWMCWKRREQKRKDRENGWFGIMRRKGFECVQMGKGIWRIQRQRPNVVSKTIAREAEIIH